MTTTLIALTFWTLVFIAGARAAYLGVTDAPRRRIERPHAVQPQDVPMSKIN